MRHPSYGKLLAPLLLLMGLLAGCADNQPAAPETPGFHLVSTAFEEGEPIPARHTCQGQDVSPPLFWAGAPDGTRSLALIVHDRDAPGGEFTHWVVFNVAGRATGLSEAAAEGAAGANDFGKQGYGGPCPPQGLGVHHYVFTLYALDLDRLDLRPGASRSELETAVQGRVLGRTQLTGTFERK